MPSVERRVTVHSKLASCVVAQEFQRVGISIGINQKLAWRNFLCKAERLEYPVLIDSIR